MYETVAMPAKRSICVCLVLLAAMASHVRAANDAGAIQVRQLPPVANGVAAFPRLIAGADPAIVEQINNALARGDALVRSAAKECISGADPGHAGWSRKVAVTMQGPRYVSYVASDDYFCGGAHPDTSTVALVFDLNTGTPVNWAKLLPELAKRTGTDTAGDGSTLGTISSPRLAGLYREAAKRDGGDPECNDALKETELNFILWPDAKAGTLVVQPVLPHVIAACGSALPIPSATLRSSAPDAELLNAIETAHRQGGSE